MPNYVSNRLEFVTKDFDVNIFLSNNENGKKYFDFNKIIPMPEELKITADGYVSILENPYCKDDSLIKTLDEMKDHNKDYEETLNNFIQSIRNYMKYGYACWYDWSIENWGTKWNSCHNDISGNVICFDTAWNFPIKIYQKIHEMYPDLEFYFEYADEDAGNNTGQGYVEAGNLHKV